MKLLNVNSMKLLVKRTMDDDISGLAAQLAYFFLLSLFPLLIVIVSLIPYLPITQLEILSVISDFAPGETLTFIESNLKEVMSHQSGSIISIGIIATLWTGSNGMNAIIRALNKAYDVKESRSFIVARGMAIVFTVALIFVFLIALLFPVFGKQIGMFLFTQLGYSNEFLAVWNTLRWFISALIIYIVFLVLYWIAPNKKFKCIEAAPGALFATVSWLIVSYGFAFYVGNFGNYSATYGSIGAVIVLMIWFYLTAIMILLGGEINALASELKNENCK